METKKGTKTKTHLDLIPELPHLHCGPLRTAQSRLAFIPGVAHRHRELRTVAVEREGGDGGVEFGVLSEALFHLVVPDGDGGVGAGRGECVVAGRGRGLVEGIEWEMNWEVEV